MNKSFLCKIFVVVICVCTCLSHSNAQTVGLFQNTSDSFNGYTLFAPSNNNITYLIDNCGNQINSWIAETPPAVSAYLLEDGSLLRTAKTGNSFLAGGSGGRIQLFDWEGNTTWSFDYSSVDYQQHHDVEYLANGNILMIAWERHSEEEAQQLGRIASGEVWSEKIIEVEPINQNEGNIVWEWRLWDHLIQDVDDTLQNYGVISEHPELWNINFNPNNEIDWLHFNSIDYNEDLDQILLSSRTLSEFYVIDHSTNTAEAASHEGGNSGKGGDILYRWGNPQVYNRGSSDDQKLFGQHDVHWISEELIDGGKIMLFNNGANRPDGNYSTVEIIEPNMDENGFYPVPTSSSFLPEGDFWSYGENEDDFYSSRLSGAQRLKNGNTLICNGQNGHIFEIDLNEETVWDYINPVAQDGPFDQGIVPSNNRLFRAYRYSPDYSAFENRDLSPGVAIEGNPINQDCIVYEDAISSLPNPAYSDIFVLQNPIKDQLVIKNTIKRKVKVRVNDLTGRIFAQTFSDDQSISFDTEDWQKGIYFVHIFEKETAQFSTVKIIKL